MLDSKQEEVFDLESRLIDQHHQALRLWLRMLSCRVKIENGIRGHLHSEFDIILPPFDLMPRLDRYPECLRMGELSQRMMVTDNNVTGITDQLQRENLVEHVSDPEDRRAIEGLTEFALLLLED
jgi:DNA-binding MarR family transcriptional regulator